MSMLQVLTDGPYAILGARESDCFAKYDRTTGEALFVRLQLMVKTPILT